MSNSVSISGTKFTISGTVKNSANEGVQDLHVLAYDEDVVHDDFLGIAVTDANGAFSLEFDGSKFQNILDKSPDLYFIVKDAGLELLNTKDNVIKDANESTPPINLVVNMINDKLRKLINNDPLGGWNGTFYKSNPDFAYPTPDLSSLEMKGNLKNIDKLTRQQKVLWPEFSWETHPGEEDPKRCYQMFAPDISRLGYDDDGRVYSIICPQQGFSTQHFGNMNVEVTVTGNRGWANEATRELAADMTVEGRIWFSPSAQEVPLLKRIADFFRSRNLKFPLDKDRALVVKTHKPGEPNQPIFPLTNGLTDKFPIPDFAKHEGISWTKGHLGVQIGAIEKTGESLVDDFNQILLDKFNSVAGNMLKEGNILTWNVWFTAPEKVVQKEWEDHAEYWRKSIEADHGSPTGPGTVPRHYDGTPYQPVKELLVSELPKIMKFIRDHIEDEA